MGGDFLGSVKDCNLTVTATATASAPATASATVTASATTTISIVEHIKTAPATTSAPATATAIATASTTAHPVSSPSNSACLNPSSLYIGVMNATTTTDGQTVYVARKEGERGSKGPFFVVYTAEAKENRYGYFCGNCERIDNAMDPMGRIECNVCGNVRKPTEWDAAHE